MENKNYFYGGIIAILSGIIIFLIDWTGSALRYIAWLAITIGSLFVIVCICDYYKKQKNEDKKIKEQEDIDSQIEERIVTKEIPIEKKNDEIKIDDYIDFDNGKLKTDDYIDFDNDQQNNSTQNNDLKTNTDNKINNLFEELLMTIEKNEATFQNDDQNKKLSQSKIDKFNKMFKYVDFTGFSEAKPITILSKRCIIYTCDIHSLMRPIPNQIIRLATINITKNKKRYFTAENSGDNQMLCEWVFDKNNKLQQHLNYGEIFKSFTDSLKAYDLFVKKIKNIIKRSENNPK